MSRSVEIRSLDRLAGLTGQRFDPALQAVLERYPVRLTEHLVPLVRQNPEVARQYLPDIRELDPAGERDPFVGLVPTGARGVERIYHDRCVVLLAPGCPVSCRFCFRRHHRHLRAERPLAPEELEAALGYVAADHRLREVLITGGEPLTDRPRLERLLAGLRRPGMEHIGPLRLACRSLVVAPQLIDDELVALLAAHQQLREGRPVELAAHINHPDEIGPQTVEALARLRAAGLHVYNQAVLLRGVNDDAGVLARLLWTLRRHGVETYALFFPEPVRGATHLRPTLARARALKAGLRRAGSGRCNPHLIVTTRLGKLEPGVDGEEVEREPDGCHVWLRTPYTLEGFRALDPGFRLPGESRVGPHGLLEVRYLDGSDGAG